MIKGLWKKYLEIKAEKEYLANWHEKNSHNEVSPIGYINPDLISIGKRSYGSIKVSAFGNPDEFLKIGNYVSIAPGVHFLLGGEHVYSGFSTFPSKVKLRGDEWEAPTKGPIVVEDDVWIGSESLILSGVTIGQGAVVAAKSLVVKDIPPYAIVGGNPAKIIKYRFSPDLIDKLLCVDFSSISDENLLRNIELLYTEITEDNVDSIIGCINYE